METNLGSGSLKGSRPGGLEVFALLLSFLVLFCFLGRYGLLEPDEGRYAEVAREMAATGDYLHPRFDGLLFYDKPPLAYWAMALSFRLFGVTEFAARLPIALCAAATLAAVVALGASVGRRRAGYLGATVLATSLGFAVMARTVTMDTVLACFVTWSLAAFWIWYRRRSRGALNAFPILLGLAFLTKGPVGAILPLITVVVFLALRGELRLLRSFCPFRSAALFCLVALPWYIVVSAREEGLLRFFLVRETLDRFFSGVHLRSEPWWYFGPVALGLLMPWVPLILLSVVRWRGVRSLEEADRRSFGLFLLAWFLPNLLFFSLSGSKLPAYILPLLPAAALPAGFFLDDWCAAPLRYAKDALARAGIALTGVIFLVTVPVAAVVLFLVFPGARAHLLLPLALVTAVALANALLSAGRRAALRPRRFIASLLLTAAASLLVGFFILPHIELHLQSNWSVRRIAERIRRSDPSGRAEVIVHHRFFYGFPFYLERPVIYAAPDMETLYPFPRDAALRERRLIDEEAFLEALRGPGRFFLLVKENDFRDFKPGTKKGLFLLERYPRYLLLSNRPDGG